MLYMLSCECVCPHQLSLVIVSPISLHQTKRIVQEHFNCFNSTSLPGAEVEDYGGSTTVHRHWEERLFAVSMLQWWQVIHCNRTDFIGHTLCSRVCVCVVPCHVSKVGLALLGCSYNNAVIVRRVIPTHSITVKIAFH